MERFFQAGKCRFPLGERTYIMGILNVTPDSFSDGGKYFQPEQAVAHALEMQEQGADILDIGGQSTRPGHVAIPWEKEWVRIAPVLSALQGKVQAAVSVDTFYPQVAERALAAGADIINDVTGFSPEMWQVAGKYPQCGCIVMHWQELSPQEDAAAAVHRFFLQKKEEALAAGISLERLCMDPGVGFGKSYEQNLQLLAQVEREKLPETAFLMAASRKRVIGAPCGDPPFEERMAGTLAAHTLAVAGGADILRVHDIREAVQAARVADAVLHHSWKSCGKRKE